MDSRLIVLWMLLSSSCTGIQLEGNGYTDIVVAISSGVPQDNALIERIKDMFTEGSMHLFEAMDNMVYFRNVTILVPPHWSSKDFTKATTESYEKAGIRIDKANPGYGDAPYTKQYEDCGSENEYIHFTPDFFLNDDHFYGSRGRVLVHEWAHLRWGVYNDYNEENPFNFSNGVQATRCSKHIAGQQSEEVAFCRENEHNAAAPNLQNEKCGNRATWLVIFEDSVDSAAIQSLQPLQSAPPAPTFTVVQRMKRVVCLILDVSGSMEAEAGVAVWDEVNHSGWKTIGGYWELKRNQRRSRVSVSVCYSEDIVIQVKLLCNPVGGRNALFCEAGRNRLCVSKKESIREDLTVTGARILRQRQAATHFLQYIIEDQAYVGIVTFSDEASILKKLTHIDNDTTRKELIESLPTIADGWTYICKGLSKGLEVLREDNLDALGDEIIFLTDGEASDNLTTCVPSAIQNGAIIHTIALGTSAAQALRHMADKTGGKFIIATDDLISNMLVDAFASLTIPTGDYTKEPVQLESVGIKTAGWFNGTVSVDPTVGNKTSFLIIYETSLPTGYIQSPSGYIYSLGDMISDTTAKTITLKIPGTAEAGDWKYSILSGRSQSLTITSTSQAAHADVPPIIVKAHVNQQFSDGSKPMIVFAEVSQNYRSIVNAEVWATLEPETGAPEIIQLLDNGAGADAFKDDGIYSRYFTKLVKGRSSLKVRVRNKDGQARFTLHRKSGVVNDKVKLNLPKLPVNDQPLVVENFTRTATGESFEVSFVSGTEPPNYPPNKITDLKAEIKDDTVLLIWTAPGEDLDLGTAKSYEIRWSNDHEMLRLNFSDAFLINTSAVSPQESGSVEQHSFNMIIQNGATIFFAIRSEDKDAVKSKISNIVQVTKILPAPGLNFITIIVFVCVATISVCFCFCVVVKRRR
ncbi:calcium-activated chloride channel regulator 3A-1-like [Paramisgurnus dabryanus]|uniref:calcium-activated chloride channel regulator 3A-1-like n=1 Tax=Paramisgurnus dabryanus TaxID=90735 RepID=UPI003CCF5C2F